MLCEDCSTPVSSDNIPYCNSKKKKSGDSGMGEGAIYTHLGENHFVFMSNVFNQIRKHVYYIFVVF